MVVRHGPWWRCSWRGAWEQSRSSVPHSERVAFRGLAGSAALAGPAALADSAALAAVSVGCGARNANPNPNQHADPNPYQHANPDKHANPNPARCAECWRCLLLTVRRSRDLTCELYGFTPTFAHSAALSWLRREFFSVRG